MRSDFELQSCFVRRNVPYRLGARATTQATSTRERPTEHHHHLEHDRLARAPIPAYSSRWTAFVVLSGQEANMCSRRGDGPGADDR
jgi:hypothetical protein